MIPRRRESHSGSRGVAVLEYVLMVSILVGGIGVSMGEFEDELASDASDTAIGIAGDPYTANTTTTIPSGTSSIPGPSTTQAPVEVNEAPVVDVPNMTIRQLDLTPGSELTLRTTITDDITPLDLMDITVTWTTGLGGDGSYVEDYVNTPGEWIEHNHPAQTPGIYTVKVTAHDGLQEHFDIGTVKVTAGLVSVEAVPFYYNASYHWDVATSSWVWRYFTSVYVRDQAGNLMNPSLREFARVSFRETALYYDANGDIQVQARNTFCTIGYGQPGECNAGLVSVPGIALAVVATVTGVTGYQGGELNCTAGWDGLDPTTVTWSGLGDPPVDPPVGASTTTTSTISTTSTTTSTSTTTTTIAPTTSTTINDNT
jgi:hypothetical protein